MSTGLFGHHKINCFSLKIAIFRSSQKNTCTPINPYYMFTLEKVKLLVSNSIMSLLYCIEWSCEYLQFISMYALLTSSNYADTSYQRGELKTADWQSASCLLYIKEKTTLCSWLSDKSIVKHWSPCQHGRIRNKYWALHSYCEVRVENNIAVVIG